MEEISDENWGVSAALDLLQKNWTFVLFALLAHTISNLYKPDQRYVLLGNQIPPLDPIGVLLAVLISLGIVCLFLRQKGVVIERIGLLLGACIALCAQFWFYIPALIVMSLAESHGGTVRPDAFGAFLVVCLSGLIALAVGFYAFCMLPEVCRDGHFNFQAMVSGVNRRGWFWICVTLMPLVCGLIFMAGIMAVLIGFNARNEVSDLFVQGVFAAASMWLQVFYIALSVIWLLNPRGEAIEPPVSWHVPPSLEA